MHDDVELEGQATRGRSNASDMRVSAVVHRIVCCRERPDARREFDTVATPRREPGIAERVGECGEQEASSDVTRRRGC